MEVSKNTNTINFHLLNNLLNDNVTNLIKEFKNIENIKKNNAIYKKIILEKNNIIIKHNQINNRLSIIIKKYNREVFFLNKIIKKLKICIKIYKYYINKEKQYIKKIKELQNRFNQSKLEYNKIYISNNNKNDEIKEKNNIIKEYKKTIDLFERDKLKLEEKYNNEKINNNKIKNYYLCTTIILFSLNIYFFIFI